MVSRTRQGSHARYAISDPSVFLCEQVCGGVRRQLGELDAILLLAVGQRAAAHSDSYAM